MDLVVRRHRFRPWVFEDVRAFFESRGCTLLEQHYGGSKQVMRYLCPSGHEYAQRFDHFVAGHGCPLCRNDRRWHGRRIDLDNVLVAIEDEGLTDIAVHRDGGRIRIAYTCTAGHRTETQYAHFLEGKRCRGCWRKHQRGPGHPNYNHSLTEEDREIGRKYEAYAAWRTAVFVRDGYACCRCGLRGRLNAHHVVNYSSARDQRTEITNGITLCIGCHRSFHREFGFRENSADQLRQFLGAAWV